METSSVSNSSSGQQASSSNGSLRELDLDHFLTLMITELQNQDPLNPLENHQILQQISQIREIEATSQLRDTLDSVLLGQNLANASGLLERQIRGLTDGGKEVSGQVERVTVADGQVKLHVAGEQLSLSNLREVLSTAETAP